MDIDTRTTLEDRTWGGTAGESGIELLAYDPDLGAGLGPADLAVARRHARARVVSLPRGSWDARAGLPRPIFGMLLLDGLVLREVTVGRRVRAEPVGPGDIIRPWDEGALDALPLPYEFSWTVIEPAQVALLDGSFAPVLARWPQISAALLRRSVHRSHRLALQMAIDQVQGVDVRLRAILWHLAERWGRVTPDGVVIPFPLTHEVLGRLIGARRPSVTSALSALSSQGLVRRRGDGAWVLAHEGSAG